MISKSASNSSQVKPKSRANCRCNPYRRVVNIFTTMNTFICRDWRNWWIGLKIILEHISRLQIIYLLSINQICQKRRPWHLPVWRSIHGPKSRPFPKSYKHHLNFEKELIKSFNKLFDTEKHNKPIFIWVSWFHEKFRPIQLGGKYIYRSRVMG